MRRKRPSGPAAYGLAYEPCPLPDDFAFACGGRYEQSDRPITRLHLHQALEVGYCFSGSGIFVVEDKVLPYRAGDASVIGEREMHLAQSTPGTTSSWVFMLVDPSRLLAGGLAAPGILGTASLGGRSFANIVSPADGPEVCHLARLLALEAQEALEGPAPGHREAVRGLVLALMAALHRRPGRSVDGPARSGDLRRLAPALGYIGAHYHQPVGIPTLAAVCGCSPTHFRRCFSRAIGQGPLAYLVRFRLEKAAAMLRDSETPVLEAALRCGFNSLSSFQRHFRATFGCPPRAWRRRQA